MTRIGEVLRTLIRGPEFRAIRHDGEFQPVDTRQVRKLQREIVAANKASRIDPGATSSPTFFQTLKQIFGFV